MKILFIPGLLCTEEVWGDLNLFRNQFECIDADVTNSNSIQEMSEDIASRISTEAVGSIIAIGISMGGYVALSLALQQVKQLRMLILINTTSHSVNTESIPERLKMIKLTGEGRFLEVIHSSKGYCFFNPTDESDQLEIRMGIAVGATAYVNQQMAIINRKDLTQRLEEIDVPTLIISGKNDQVLPMDDSCEMFKLIRNSKLIVYNNCGHLSTLEAHDIKDDVLGFIQNEKPKI